MKLYGKYYLTKLLFSAIFLHFAAMTAEAETPPLHFYTEANGLRVILSVNNNLPVVNQTLWYIVGSQDEAQGQSGLAHILEHLMFKGTERYPDGAFSAIVSDLGGNENATTSRYYTNYYQTIASEHWARLAALEADRMKNLRFGTAEMHTEIDVVYEERLSRVENNPHAILSERALNVLYGNHPYGRPVIGWGHELLSHKENGQVIRDFYRRYYAPQNAILVVSGDIDIDSAKRVIADTYGKIPRGEAVRHTMIIEPPLPERGIIRQEISYTQADVSQEFLSFNMSAPSIGYNDKQNSLITERQDDILPLMIIADVLNSPDFALQEDLVRKKKSALGVGAHYSPLGRGPGLFSLYMVPPQGSDLAKSKKILQDKLRDIAARGLTEKQLETAKLRMRDSVLLSYDSLTVYANLAAQAMISGLAFEDFLSWQDRAAEVPLQQVNEVLRRYFGNDKVPGVWAFLQKAEEG